MLTLTGQHAAGTIPYFIAPGQTAFARERLGPEATIAPEIDAVVPHGSAGAIAEVVRGHLDVGADHVALQPLGHGENPSEDFRALAQALL